MSGARVRLEPEEVAERARQLANAVRELQLLEEDQADQRQAMAREKKAVQRRVSDLAEVVRTGIEDRPAQDQLFDDRRPEG
jgi:hypothetical protein